MQRRIVELRDAMVPPVPDEIRADFTLLAAWQLQKQLRLLFLSLTLIAPMASIAASPWATDWIRYYAPAIMGVVCLAGMIVLSRDLKIANNIERSEWLIRNVCWVAVLISAITAGWCVHSWYGAPETTRIYYPFMLSLGTFAAVYCLASVHQAAHAVLAVNLVPADLLLLTSGCRFDFAISVCLAIVVLLQLRMIAWHRRSVIELLLARQRSHEQALTDPLTGLMNRRALIDTALTLGQSGQLRLLCLDIDHFKHVNDTHGHAVGDAVLCEVAARLASRADLRASVARTGGEEFALIGLADDLPESVALGILIDIHAAPMPHGGRVTVSIGVAEGRVDNEPGWNALYNQADLALYRAKAAGRNRVEHAHRGDTDTADQAAA